MKKLIITLTAMALAAPLAIAEPGKGGPGKGGDAKGGPKGGGGNRGGIEKLDTDKDGKVSKAEFLAGPKAKQNAEKAAEVFGKMDADSDGFITKEEFVAAIKERGGDKGKGPKGGKGGKKGGDAAPE